MFNWFDLMRQAQTSAAFSMMSRQYQLSGDQTQKAMAALHRPSPWASSRRRRPTTPTGRLMQS